MHNDASSIDYERLLEDDNRTSQFKYAKKDIHVNTKIITYMNLNLYFTMCKIT